MKANERTVHRVFLNSIHLEDLSDITLYSKVKMIFISFLIVNKYLRFRLFSWMGSIYLKQSMCYIVQEFLQSQALSVQRM